MNQHFGLLNTVAQQYHILKGTSESEASWKARIIYSLLGQTGYSALFDVQDDLLPDSITHFKRRIIKALSSLLAMYPDMREYFSVEDDSLANEIYELFLLTGCIYHEPNRVVPCMRKGAEGEKSTFLRGQALNEKRWLSGNGCYFPTKGQVDSSCNTIDNLYSLQQIPLAYFWTQLTEKASFDIAPQGINLEFLRMVPPFSNGYWNNIPDMTGGISLARTVFPGGRIYYLYRYADHTLLISQLPEWMTEGYHYRSISVACLEVRGTLPETVFHVDGNIVKLKIGYLFPPEELNLIKLYSWPISYVELPHDFNRIISLPVFEEIRILFEKLGYRFREE